MWLRKGEIMNENKNGRRWILFWTLVAASLLAVPAISGWASSATDTTDEPAEQRTLVRPEFVPMKVSMSMPGPTLQDGDQAEVRTDVHVVAPGKYWIGVLARPLEPMETDLVKSQLGVEQGLMLERIVPDSPADKGGLKAHDILIKVGDRPLTDLRVLVESIEKAQEGEMEVTLVRKAEQQTVKISPAKRPERVSKGDDEQTAERQRVLKSLSSSVTVTRKQGEDGDDDGSEFVVVMPGLLLPDEDKDLPDNLEISITKKGKEKAKIHVKKGDQEWNIDEDALEELDEAVRPYVKRFLNRGVHGPASWTTGGIHLGQKHIDLSKIPGVQASELERWFKVAPGKSIDLQKILPGAKSRIVVRSEVKSDSDEKEDEKTIEVTIDGQMSKLEQTLDILHDQLKQLREKKSELSEPNSKVDQGVEALEKAIESLQKAQRSPEEEGQVTPDDEDNTRAIFSQIVLA
jgi:hypothetical protein